MVWSAYLRSKAQRLGIDSFDDVNANPASTSSENAQKMWSALSSIYHLILLECFSEEYFEVFQRYTLAIDGPSADGRLGNTKPARLFLLRTDSDTDSEDSEAAKEDIYLDFVVEALDGSPVLLLSLAPLPLRRKSSTERNPSAPSYLPATEGTHACKLNDPRLERKEEASQNSLRRASRVLAHRSNLPKLYCVHAEGRRVVCYEYDVESDVMSEIVGSREFELAEDGVDILSDEGHTLFSDLAEEIEWMVRSPR